MVRATSERAAPWFFDKFAKNVPADPGPQAADDYNRLMTELMAATRLVFCLTLE